MKTLMVIALALSSGAAMAQSGTGASGNTARANNDPNRLVCRVERETGSMLNRRRTCMTQAQWDEQARQDRQTIERAQSQGTTNGH